MARSQGYQIGRQSHQDGQDGRHGDADPPIQTAKCVEHMGHGVIKGHTRRQNGDEQAEIPLGPAAGHLEGDGITASHAGPGNEAQAPGDIRGRSDQQD